MSKKNDAGALVILKKLKKNYPDAKSALDFSDPVQLLIATILSAQCTDARVNIVTQTLFKKYKSPVDYLKVPVTELEKDIFSTGFYRQKAKSIRACCAKLIELYDAKVPADFNKLNDLPGVGRKTASVVAGNAFGIPAIAVDTHVKRLSNLFGWSKSDNPDKIEEDLKQIIPQKDWIVVGHLIATHGRATCVARSPKCNDCFLADDCPSVNI